VVVLMPTTDNLKLLYRLPEKANKNGRFFC